MKELNADHVFVMQKLAEYFTHNDQGVMTRDCLNVAEAIEDAIQTPTVPDTVKGDEKMGLM